MEVKSSGWFVMCMQMNITVQSNLKNKQFSNTAARTVIIEQRSTEDEATNTPVLQAEGSAILFFSHPAQTF